MTELAAIPEPLTLEEQALLDEYLARQSAKNSLDECRAYYARSGHPDFTHPHALHHQVMAENFQWWIETPYAKLIICMPFGSGKSVLSSVQLPLYLWSLDPTADILCASNTAELAESFARRRRDACESPEFFALTGHRLRPDKKSVKAFANTAGGQMRALGVNAAAAGYRAKYLIVDDFAVDFQQQASRAIRDQIHMWYTSIARSRLEPKGRELIVNTRYSSDDLVGRLLREEDDWRVIVIPEVADSPDDPLDRNLGERLWPEYLSDRRLLIQEANPMVWSGSYQQKPLMDEGGWLGREHFMPVKTPPHNVNNVIALDIAHGGTDGDFSVIINAAFTHPGNICIVDVWRKHCPVHEMVEMLAEFCLRYEPSIVLCDDDNPTKVFKTLCLDYFTRHSVRVPLYTMKIGGRNKEVRAAAFRSYALQGRVSMVQDHWNALLIQECEGFPDSARHDDQVDALSLIGRHFSRASKPSDDDPLNRRASKREEVEYAIMESPDGSKHTRATMNEMAQDYDDEKRRRKSIRRIC